MLRALFIWLQEHNGKISFAIVLLTAILYVNISYSQEVPNNVSSIATIEYKQPDTISIQKKIEKGMAVWPYSVDSATILFESALKESEQAHYFSGVISSIFRLYVIYISKGMYDKALTTFKEAFFICAQSNEMSSGLHMIANCIANIYQAQGDYEKAALYYSKTIAALEQYKISSTGGVYSNVGEMLLQLKHYRQALYFLDIAERLAIEQIAVQKHDCYDVLGYVLAQKSIAYLNLQEWKKSELYANTALDISRKHDLPQLQYNTLVNLGNIYLQTNRPQQAIQYILQVTSIKTSADFYYQNTAIRLLGEAYYQLHDYAKAEHFLLQALNKAQISSLGSGLMETHKMLSTTYTEKGQYQQALEHYKQYTQLKDSFTGIDATKNVAQLEIKYKSAEKDKEIIKKQLQITQQQKWIAGIIAGMLGLVVLLIIIFTSYRNKQKLQLKQLHILQQEQEIANLKAMMEGEEKERKRIGQDLHDGIGGMLAAINMNFKTLQRRHPYLSDVDDLNEILSMVQSTAKEVRKTAHNLLPDILLDHTLPEALHLYCDQINDHNLQVSLQCYGALNELQKPLTLSLYRIIQELIQNVIKHAHATNAIIQIRRLDEILSIMVEDNGLGFDTETKTWGLGLKNIQSRVHTLCGSISIESTHTSGTTVYIEIDLEQMKNTVSI